MDYIKSLVSSDQSTPVTPTRTETPSQRRRRLEQELEASKNPTSFADTLQTYATTAYETVAEGAGYVVKNAQEYFNKDGNVNENSDEARRRAKEEGEYGGYVRVRKGEKYQEGGMPQQQRRPSDGRVRHGQGQAPRPQQRQGQPERQIQQPHRQVQQPQRQIQQPQRQPPKPQRQSPPARVPTRMAENICLDGPSARTPQRQQQRQPSSSSGRKPVYDEVPSRGARWASRG
jgi:hypothetical protein